MIRTQHITKNIDWITVGLVLALAIIGWATIYSAAYDENTPSIFSFSKEYGKQIFWMGVSVILVILIINIEGEFFEKYSWHIYAFVILLLLLVLIIGKEVNGAKAWFRIGSFGIQPSEFSKMAIALVLSDFIASSNLNFQDSWTQTKAAAILLVPAALILKQPDVGTLLVYMGFVFVMFREGLSSTILIGGLGSIAFGVAAIISSTSEIDFWFAGPHSGIYALYVFIVATLGFSLLSIKMFTLPRYRKKKYLHATIWGLVGLIFCAGVSFVINSDSILKGYQKERILNTLGILEDNQGAGYNLNMSKTAIGSGGFAGKGYLEGPMTKYHFVPEQHTDFIFTAIGEEWGFLGSALVIVLYMGLCLRLIFLAERQRSTFSRVYGYSCAAIIFMHFVINIGMVIGLAPVIGIPLPLVSYGGSSLMGFTMLIFIMVRLDAERLSVFR